MSFQDSLRSLANGVRGIATDFGVRNYSVTIRTETFADSNQLGTPTVSDLTLTPRPKVREASMGRELIVGPITPSHSGGGYTVAQLNPVETASTSVRVTYRVTGDNGTKEYVLKDIDTGRGYSYFLTLHSLDYSGPS